MSKPYLQIHDRASRQSDSQKYWTGNFEHLQSSVFKHVADETECEHDTKQ